MAKHNVFVQYSLLLSFSIIPRVIALRIITPCQSILYNQTLVSESGNFEAGFFSIGNSRSQYFCIWYKSLTPKTIVWVANRDSPVDKSTAMFKITDAGNPFIVDGSGTTIWFSNATKTLQNPVLLLQDTGNLVVGSGENIVWQSFDYPGDTLLPGMVLHGNRVSGEHNSLTSWRNTADPGRGEFSYHLDSHGYPQLVIMKGSKLIYRLGSWNGFLFSGIPWEILQNYFNFSFELAEQEIHFKYEILDDWIVSRYMITPTGGVQRFMWLSQAETWLLLQAAPTNQCDNYGFCGANSDCSDTHSPTCECLPGFTPKSPEKWSLSIWTDGCVRKVNLDCDSRDGFVKLTSMMRPDTSSSWFDENMDLQECANQCLKNCNCIAYANVDIRHGGSGCLIWFNNIMDMRKETSIGQDIYIKVAASELGYSTNNANKNRVLNILVGIGILVLGITIVGCIIYLKRKKLMKSGMDKIINQEDDIEKYENGSIDLPIFDFSTLVNATNNFSTSKILGEGGYGPVYKGVLANGKEIAIKRLSLNSGQGPKEFRNEVLLVANLQHRNLVKLLGYCIENVERILIYEFMPNKSLDNFIFEKTRSKVMEWNKRLQIISGIARGLVYLHQDSRLRIIHRDLKTSNILLDSDMNPKISDFGLARTFGGDHSVAKTERVAGTHGYMSPEYAVYGTFSVKSDVFSYGVIVLEMVSGRKNREFSDPQHNLNLLGHAWKLWSEDRTLELIDESLSDSVIAAEALRCVHIGLLCVQERADDRPDMSSVVIMLNGERALANPKQPGFFPHEVPSSKHELSSINELSISLLEAR